MITQLRMPDDLYQDELGRICAPHMACDLLRQSLADPSTGFYHDMLPFLHRQYQAEDPRLEEAFQQLQQDLARGRVLIARRVMPVPAFHWQPPQGDEKGHWQLGPHVLPEHQPILQRALEQARGPVASALLSGAVESPSAIGRAFETAKGAAKQVANDLMRRNAALNAQWQADKGMATFTDKASGDVLSADEVKARWENEGKDVLPIDGADQQAGAQIAKESPALGAVAEAAMIVGSKGRSAARNPDDVVDSVGDLIKGPKSPDIDKRKADVSVKVPKMNQYEPPCFQPGPDARKNYQGSDKDFEKEYHKQLKMQENGINNMSVGEYLDNRRILQALTDQYGSEKARKILTQGGKAQAKERAKLRAEIHESIEKTLEKRGVPEDQIEEIARKQTSKQMEQLAALHNPDLIVGGKDEIGRMGNKGVNSSIGAQWPKQGRITGMDEAAQSALDQFGPDAKMNVKLERCR